MQEIVRARDPCQIPEQNPDGIQTGFGMFTGSLHTVNGRLANTDCAWCLRDASGE